MSDNYSPRSADNADPDVDPARRAAKQHSKSSVSFSPRVETIAPPEDSKPLLAGESDESELVKFTPGFVGRIRDSKILEVANDLAPDERVQVTMRNVSVTAKSRVANREFETVASAFAAPAHAFKSKARTDILSNITTVFTPGHVCCVVGPPQCGKSTLLRLIILIIFKPQEIF